MYIKIKDNLVEKYPYSISELKSDNPQTSFPETISDETLAEFNVYKVTQIEKPVITYKQNLIEGTPVNENGAWKQTWAITDKPLTEIEEIQTNNKAEAYRTESDPIFFKWQRGEATQQEWLDKVAEIKLRWI
jgi:hypothetical protein